jgi:hypothetical protein
MVRLNVWERESGLRLLLGLPVLEGRVRKSVRSTWLADLSHFGGLWLHVSERLYVEQQLGEVRDLLAELTPSVPPSESAPETAPATLR